MTRTQAINLVWLAAVVGFALAGYVPGLLAVIALLLMDGVIKLDALRHALAPMVAAFDAGDPEMSEARAEELTADIMARVQDEMKAQASRRAH